MIIKYKNEDLTYIKNFHGYEVLMTINPLQKNMEKNKHIGNMNNEYGYYLKDLNFKERNDIHKQVNGYDWNDVSNRKINTIGLYWQNGIIIGTIDAHLMHFAYYCSCYKNEKFFTILEINEETYNYLKTTYNNYLGSKNNYKSSPNSVQIEIYNYLIKYGNVIYEGWNCL